jgi:hypothetical protein
MADLNLIPCCFGNYCGSYNSGLADGYVLGILTLIMVLVLIEIVNMITEQYKFKEDSEGDKKND